MSDMLACKINQAQWCQMIKTAILY